MVHATGRRDGRRALADGAGRPGAHAREAVASPEDPDPLEGSPGQGSGPRTGDATGGAHRAVPRPNASPLALASLTVFVVFAAASLVAFFVTRHVVSRQERLLLEERGDEVGAVLSSTVDSASSSLRILAEIGTSTDPGAPGLITESADRLVARQPQSGVSVASAAPGGSPGAGGGPSGAGQRTAFSVLASAGTAPPAGTTLDADRAALAARALDEHDIVPEILRRGGETRMVFAVPASGPEPVVAFQESIVRPDLPVPSSPTSAFRELRVAVYASTTNDPSRLVLTTERQVPLTGHVVRKPLDVGAERWLVAVSAREPLVGSFARISPWLLLIGGLVAAGLATAVAETLARRRSFAYALVRSRTAELTETRAFLERLLTAGPVLVKRIVLPEREVGYVSPNVEQLLGVSSEQALRPGFHASLVHPEDRPAFEAALDRVAAGCSGRELSEYRMGPIDGAYRWMAAVLVPEAGSDGHIGAVLAYVVDVEERRSAEEAQRLAHDAAEAANRAKSEFLSRMSHELRTPLNAVLGFGQLLELENLTVDQREFVDQILKGGRHLLDLINEVLDISRIEAGEMTLSPEPVEAAELVQEAVDLIKPMADQRGVQVVIDRAALGGRYVFADRQRAKQVLLNLLSNAVKYNRPRGTVAVGSEHSTETRLRLAVSDTGGGIAAERLGQLFVPFERLGAEHTEVEGTGIGLALSRRLTEAMGGDLTVRSALGKGSTFTIDLPRVEGPVERFERLNGDVGAPVAPAVARRRILHIEDNLSNLKLVERIVAHRPDVEIVPAMHGRLGLELAQEHQPALVLLDLHLPDMAGDEVLQRLRDHPVTSSIPVVMVSADATPGQVRRLLASGATAYVTKPIDVRDLLGIIDDVLRRV
jgi:PAS domain S-box-containing protein